MAKADDEVTRTGGSSQFSESHKMEEDLAKKIASRFGYDIDEMSKVPEDE